MSNSLTFTWRCDRCGREQEGDYDPKAADTPMPVQWTRIVQFKDGTNVFDQNADLCRECTDALAKWMAATAVPA